MPRLFLFLVLGSLVALGLLGVLVIEPRGPYPLEHLAIGYLLGTMFGHTTLAAAWAALGPWPLFVRLPLSLVWLVAVMLAFILNFSMHGGPDDVVGLIAVLLAGQWVLVQLPLWGLAFWYGVYLRHSSDPQQPVASQRQFGIRQVMVLTAIVGVALGLGRVLVANLADQLKPQNWLSGEGLIFIYLAVAGVVLSLPLVLATLVPRYAPLATAGVLALTGLATIWQLPLMQSGGAVGPGPDIWHLVYINGFLAAWIVGVMALVRLGGYGLNFSADR